MRSTLTGIVFLPGTLALSTGCRRAPPESPIAATSSQRTWAAGGCDSFDAVETANVGGSRFAARVLAATAIEVTVDTPPDTRPPLAVCAERRTEQGWTQPHCSEEGLAYQGRHGAVMLEADPNRRETYRATIDPGTGSQDAWIWSESMNLHLPPAPQAPPPTPQAFTARALSPYAAELAWSFLGDCAHGAYGFEVLRGRSSGEAAEKVDAGKLPRFPYRVALREVGTDHTTIHGLTPGATYAFRIRSFNPTGASPASEVRTVTLPPGPRATVSREHMNAFVYGVRLTVLAHGQRQDVDSYAVCPGGTWASARGEVDGSMATLRPPFGDVCQSWPAE